MSNSTEKPIEEHSYKGSEETNAASTFTCEICIEPAPLSQKFHHDKNRVHNICLMCLASHIQAKVDENMAMIKCPELGCKETLDPVECRPMIPPELFVKWCDCLCRLSVSILKSRYCPYQSCSELILNECNQRMKKCKCPGCKRLFCYKCRVPWHAGFWCSENHQQMDSNDQKFGSLLEKMKWTRCPDCGQPIELVGGCINVKCRCGGSFCHNCGRPPHSERCVSANRNPRGRSPCWLDLLCGGLFICVFFGWTLPLLAFGSE